MLYLKKGDIEEFSQIYNDFMLQQFPQPELKSYDDFFETFN